MTAPSDLPTLPEGWVWTSLEEILGFVKGKKPKNLGAKSEFLKIPYINIQAFENGVFNQFTDGNDCPLCKMDDILIVWDGARCGLVGRGVAGAIGSTLAKLCYYELNSLYPFYFLQSKYDYINKRPRGVGIPHVEPSIFWNINFPLPPLPEQHRIVAKIEVLFTKLDAGVEVLKKGKALLKRYRQAVLKHAFEGKLTEEWREMHKNELEPASMLMEQIKEERKKNAKGKYNELPSLDTSDLPELPEGWVWARVGNICETTSGGTPSRKNKRYYGGDIPWLKSGELKNNIISSTEEYITDEGLENASTKIIPEGTLLMALYGATVGKLGIMGIDSAINQAICAIFTHPQLEKKYLFWYLMNYRSELLNSRMGGAQPNISQTIVNKTILPLPSHSEQQIIVEEIERRFSVADVVERIVDQSLKQAERLHQSILKKAFEGKLVPQDPNDEPASLLIERIKKERALIQSKEKKKKRIKTKPRVKRQEKMDREFEAEIKTKSLYKILKSSKKPLTPEELWKLSKLDIDDFYTQLKKEVEKGLIMERRPNETEVFLEVEK